MGRCCRQSRRVSPVTIGLRVLQRYLVMASKVWEKQKLEDKTRAETGDPGKRPNAGLSMGRPAKRARS